MKTLVFLALSLIACNQTSAADHVFTPTGANHRFVVDAALLAKTPRWNPLSEECPVTAAQAIKIAARYHEQIMPNGRSESRTFLLTGAALVACDHDRWFWVVQYEGAFNPNWPDRRPDDPSGAWIPVLTNRYPVLLSGKMPPRTTTGNTLPAAIRQYDGRTDNLDVAPE